MEFCLLSAGRSRPGPVQRTSDASETKLGWTGMGRLPARDEEPEVSWKRADSWRIIVRWIVSMVTELDSRRERRLLLAPAAPPPLAVTLEGPSTVTDSVPAPTLDVSMMKDAFSPVFILSSPCPNTRTAPSFVPSPPTFILNGLPGM